MTDENRLNCVLSDSNDEKAATFDTKAEFHVYVRSPGRRGLKRRQFVRLQSTGGQHVYRYVMRWGPLKEHQALVDWDTAQSLGFEYDDLKNGLAKIELLPTRPFVDQIAFILQERHPDIRLGLVSGLVSGVITGSMLLLVDKLL